jgi:cytochrome P450 family 6
MQAGNLFMMNDQKWRDMRNKLSPTFTSGKMKNMFPLVEECSKNLQIYVDKHQNEDIDIKVVLPRVH